VGIRRPLLQFVLGLLILVALPAAATMVEPKELEQLVPEASLILVATITKVDVIDAKGRQLHGRLARTGPGSPNLMRFHLKVEEVVHSAGKQVPNTVVVPQWQMWHYTLEQMKQEEGKRAIFLLKTDSYEPVYPAFFDRELGERPRIEDLLNK